MQNKKQPQKASSVRAWTKRFGRLRALIIGVGALAGALVAVLTLIYMLFPGLKPSEPPSKRGGTLSISRVEHKVTFGEYLRRPDVPRKGAVDSHEQLDMVGNVIYFDVNLQGFAKQRAYVRYTVYDADTDNSVKGLINRSAWPSDIVIPESQTSTAQKETWVAVPQNGSSGPYKIWLELYTLINEQETRLASDEVTIGR